MAGRAFVSSLAGALEGALDVVSEEPAVALCTGLGEDVDAPVRQRLRTTLQCYIENLRWELGTWDAGPLDALISVASKHLLVLETCARVDAISMDITSRIHKWIGRWRAGAAEAAALGFGRDVSCKYWQRNIELPEAITMARKWFTAAKKLVKADPSLLYGKLIKEGYNYSATVAECHDSWPRYRRLSIIRRYLKWQVLLARWAYALMLVALKEKASDAAELRALITKLAVGGLEALHTAQATLTRREKEQAAFRAIMLKKRTCAHCGTTGPLSQRSFAYCGGCRQPGVAREHWTRYCSDACRRAHWAAGHKDECPCAH